MINIFSMVAGKFLDDEPFNQIVIDLCVITFYSEIICLMILIDFGETIIKHP